MADTDDMTAVDPGDGPGRDYLSVNALVALGIVLALTNLALLAGLWSHWPTCEQREPLMLTSVKEEVDKQHVSLTGNGLDKVTAVSLNGVSIPLAAHKEATQLTIAVPKDVPASGPVDVSVESDGCARGFATYTPASTPPGAIRLDPVRGAIAGGTSVTIQGISVPDKVTAKDITATFGGVAATDLALANGSWTMKTPTHAAGVVDVIVVLPGGAMTTIARGFTFVGDMTLTAVQPATGSQRGCDVVTLTGTGFGPGARVMFGGLPAAAVTVSGPTTMTAVTPRQHAGKVDVAVTLAGAAATSVAGYTYICPMPDDGALLLMIVLAGALGAALHAARSFYVYVGARKLVASWLAFYLLVPIFGAGLAVVFYLLIGAGLFGLASTQPGLGFVGFSALVGMFTGQAAERLKNIAEGVLDKGLRVTDHITDTPLTVTAVTPAHGPAATVKVSGTGFLPGLGVQFNGMPATNVQVASDTEAQVTPPAGIAAGTAVPVMVTHPRKAPSRPLAAGFTY